MESRLGTTFDISGLTIDDVNELRALLKSSAVVCGLSGRTGQEGFLNGLAGLMDAYLEHLRTETGEEPTEAPEYCASAAVDLANLSVEDLRHGARTLVASAYSFECEGREELAGVFQDFAGALKDQIPPDAPSGGDASAP
jgi:hypothetical protein